MPSNFGVDVEFPKLLAHRADVDLERLMLEFAADAYPHLDRLACYMELDRLGLRAREWLARLDKASLRNRLSTISRLLYDTEGFHGDEETYYDARNSYLNDVLERRCGIPISLALVYQAVCRRAGLSVFGVGTPAHFVVGATDGNQTLYVDPFPDGAVLSRAACRQKIEKLLGQEGVLGDEHFQPATPQEIAIRVLRNLKTAHAMHDEWRSALHVQKRLAQLLPDVAEEHRDLGLMYLRTGHAQQALTLLEEFRAHCTEEQAEELAPFVRSARRLMAELN